MRWVYFLKTPDLTPGAGQWRPHRGDVRRELSIGIPMALQFAITASGGMVMQSAVNQFGSMAVAAYTAAGKLETLVEQGMIALAQGITALISPVKKRLMAGRRKTVPRTAAITA